LAEIRAVFDTLRIRLRSALATIKVRVTLSAIAATAAGIAVTTFVLVRDAERQTLAAHQARGLSDVTRTAAILSSRVTEKQRAMRAAAQLLTRSTVADGAQLSAFLEAQPVLRNQFSSVFVTTREGQMLQFADGQGIRRPSLSIGGGAYFRKAVSGRLPVVSEPLKDWLSDEPVVIFVHPLERDGEVYAVLGAALKLESRDLLGDLVDTTDAEGGALVAVTDVHGRFLAHPAPGFIMHPIHADPRLAAGYEHWLSIGGAEGGAVEPEGLSLNQPGEVLSVAGAAAPEWLVWRVQSEADLLEPLHAARRVALFYSAVIAVVCSLVVLGTIDRLLQPLGQLKRRALSLFDEASDIHEGWPQVGGEVGELARVLRHVGAQRAQLEQINAQVLAKIRSVMSAAPVGILFTRAEHIELVSAEMCRLTGRTEEQLLGQSAKVLFASADDYKALGPQVQAAFGASQPYDGEWRFAGPDGSTFWAQFRGQPVHRGTDDAGAIWTISDVSQQIMARQSLQWSATHDALTGLANRQLLEQRGAQVLRRSEPAALVVIDLDHFKPVNDTWGHAAGDAILKLVGEAIAGQLRSNDLAVRLGGDEFAVLLENCPHHAAVRIAHSIQRAVASAELAWEGVTLKVGASAGMAVMRPTTVDLAQWLNEADAACYQAKAAGRGMVRSASRLQLQAVS